MTFSDPDRDFDSEYLSLIGKKPLGDYSAYDWVNIFQCQCALGTFEETVILVDDAVKFVQSRRKGYFDVFIRILEWLECYDEKLNSLGLAVRYVDNVVAIVDSYFNDYIVVENGGVNYPLGGDVICRAFRASQSFNRLRDSLQKLNVFKCIPATFVHAAWLIELECFVREGWVSSYTLFRDENWREAAFSRAYDIVVSAIIQEDGRIECRHLASKIQENYIGV